eukprot:2838469-Rhodomonas_salina.2
MSMTIPSATGASAVGLLNLAVPSGPSARVVAAPPLLLKILFLVPTLPALTRKGDSKVWHSAIDRAPATLTRCEGQGVQVLLS